LMNCIFKLQYPTVTTVLCVLGIMDESHGR
jgi:hypothetical protein